MTPSQDATPAEVPDGETIFAGVDFRRCDALMRAFDLTAERLGGISNTTAMWALAGLLAKIMVMATDTGGQQATGELFGLMLRRAYPMMVKALEAAKREEEGRHAFDA